MDRPDRSLGDTVMQELANAGLAVIDIDAEAERLADQTMLGGISVDGTRVTLRMVPPEKIAATWLRVAQLTLGDAVNYAESVYELPPAANTHPELLQSITIPLHPTGEARERYTITVQRVGKLSPTMRASSRRPAPSSSPRRWRSSRRRRASATPTTSSASSSCSPTPSPNSATDPTGQLTR
ncbi:hypothetical protein [Nonomuraea sp. NPDC005501]|uniref:hypothetical protein n=1 Tax=Nonomuraea sp. NPDC005501 TaxID=3156884 RepID=UPI0033A3CDD0